MWGEGLEVRARKREARRGVRIACSGTFSVGVRGLPMRFWTTLRANSMSVGPMEGDFRSRALARASRTTFRWMAPERMA